MKKVKIIFVADERGFWGFISKIIKFCSGSSYSHVGIFMFDGIVEAIFPEVTVSKKEKYDDVVCKEVLEFEVTDRQWNLMQKKASQIIDMDYKYGFSDVVVSFISTVFGLKYGIWITNAFGLGHHTMHCSEVVTEIIRASKKKFMPEAPSGTITPQEMYSELKILFYNKK